MRESQYLHYFVLIFDIGPKIEEYILKRGVKVQYSERSNSDSNLAIPCSA